VTGSSVVLLSGGLDSAAALALELKHHQVVLALTVDYGQRAAAREREAAARLAEHFRVPHKVVALPFFAELDAGALVRKDGDLPRPDPDALDDPAAAAASAKAVWVPNRNGVLIEVAAAHAEALGAGRVVVGFNREEAASFPDNSLPYLNAINAALRFSTAGKVELVAPTALWDKVRILRAVRREGIELEWLWPCYEGGKSPCGSCESCRRFERARTLAGVAEAGET